MLYKLMPLLLSISELVTSGSCNGSCLLHWFLVQVLKLNRRIYCKTVFFMGDLYWSSLANSLMDYDWCKLMKCNHFQRGSLYCDRVLHPGGEDWYYLSLIQVHDINTAQLREPGS